MCAREESFARVSIFCLDYYCNYGPLQADPHLSNSFSPSTHASPPSLPPSPTSQELPNWQALQDRIRRGEARIARNKQIKEMLERKVGRELSEQSSIYLCKSKNEAQDS